MAGINHNASRNTNGVTVKIRNFAAFKGRKDVEHNSWFRCSNRLLEDPDFFDFSQAEFLVWIYILSLASQKNSGTIFINFAHAERICRLEKRHVLSGIEKLKENQLDLIDVTPTVRERYADGTQTCATEQDITEQNNTTTGVPVDCAEASAARSAPFADPSIKKFIEKVKVETQEMWISTYADKEWILAELKKAVTWILANPSKAPKSNYARFFTNWLSRGWEHQRKFMNGHSRAASSEIPRYRIYD